MRFDRALVTRTRAWTAARHYIALAFTTTPREIACCDSPPASELPHQVTSFARSVQVDVVCYRQPVLILQRAYNTHAPRRGMTRCEINALLRDVSPGRFAVRALRSENVNSHQVASVFPFFFWLFSALSPLPAAASLSGVFAFSPSFFEKRASPSEYTRSDGGVSFRGESGGSNSSAECGTPLSASSRRKTQNNVVLRDHQPLALSANNPLHLFIYRDIRRRRLEKGLKYARDEEIRAPGGEVILISLRVPSFRMSEH